MAAHICIIGLPETGKSTLAKRMAAAVKAQGNYGVLVCDPMYSQDWVCDYQTHDLHEFVRIYQDSRLCYAFIDECYMLDSADERTILTKLNAMGRHYGNRNVMIGQRFTAMPKTARELAPRKFIFNQSPEDAVEIYRRYPHEEVKQLPKLGVGEYLDLSTFACVRRKSA